MFESCSDGASRTKIVESSLGSQSILKKVSLMKLILSGTVRKQFYVHEKLENQI